MSDFKFINGIFAFLDAADGANSTSIECNSKIDHYLFYQFCLIPAVVLSLMMAATKSRIQMLRAFLNGRPGLIFPMDTLTRSSRVSYCCAFGVTGFTVYQIVWNGKFAIDYQGPTALKTLIVLVSVLIYGMVFFPVFTSLALGTAFSFFLGSLYVWMFFAIEVYKVNECDFNAAWRAVLFFRGLPNLLCLAYLSIAMPIKFCLAVRKKKYFTSSLGESAYCETLVQIKQSYQGKHVTKLLQKPEVVVPAEGLLNSLKASINGFLDTWIYHGESGFRYPSRLTSVMFIAACVIYVISVELLVTIVTYFKSIMDPIKAAMEAMNVENGEFAVQYVFFYITQIFQVSSIVAVSLSSAIIFMSILHMMSSFRTNLFALYRGDYTHIPAPETKGAIALCTGSIKYAGFQVAYIISGYIMIGVVLFIICIVLAVIITVLTLGITDWLVEFLRNYWPGLVVAIVFFVLQTLLAKFVFLQDRGQHLRLDNRRFYFVFVYFMFFYNIFLGLFSCLLRIIKALGVGLLFLPRLDNSTLPRKFEFFDPGFSAYQGYIHMEAAHTHPVVNVFIRLLAALSKDRRKNTAEEKELEKSNFAVSFDTDDSLKESDASSQSYRPVNVSARFNWFVLYTLLHNPAVRIYRKGFIQSIKKARLEGIKIPISDKPITDFDLVKTQQERDKVREEETMRNSPAHSLYNGMAAMGSLVGSHRQNGIASKPSKKTSRKPNIFKKWRIKSGCGKLATVDNVSQELDNYTLGSYVKNENV